MHPELTRYLIQLVSERRDQAAAFSSNSNHSKETRQHWLREFKLADAAYDELMKESIK